MAPHTAPPSAWPFFIPIGIVVILVGLGVRSGAFVAADGDQKRHQQDDRVHAEQPARKTRRAGVGRRVAVRGVPLTTGVAIPAHERDEHHRNAGGDESA